MQKCLNNLVCVVVSIVLVGFISSIFISKSADTLGKIKIKSDIEFADVMRVSITAEHEYTPEDTEILHEK